MPADDLTDPAPATTFAHLDATTVLSRKIVEQGIYPPWIRWIPPAASWKQTFVGEEHYRVARKVQATLQRYQELQDIIAILGMDELDDNDKLTVAAPAKSRNSCPSRSSLPRTLPACRANMCPWPKLSRALPPSWTVRSMICPNGRSSTWAR